MEGKRLLKLLRRSLTRSNTMFNSRYRPSESCFGLDLRTQVSHDILYTFSTRCTDTLQRRPCILPGCPSLLVLRGWGFSRPTLPNGPQHDPRWPWHSLRLPAVARSNKERQRRFPPGRPNSHSPNDLANSPVFAVRCPRPQHPWNDILAQRSRTTPLLSEPCARRGEGWWATSPL